MAGQLERTPIMEKAAAINANVNDNIISLFECPVCFEYLIPPIYQCRNSHHVCCPCKSRLTRCPTCKETFLDARSIFAEQITEHLLYPCKNLEAGCYEKCSQKEIAKHHAVCAHRLYECRFGQPGCMWRGRNYEIQAHVTESHHDSAWMEEENNILYECNIFQGLNDLQLVSACREIFLYNLKCDTERNKLFLAVQFIGLKDLASNFTYELFLTSDEDDEESMSLKSRTLSDTVDINTIYQSESCLAIDFDTLRRYVHGDNLSFILRIAGVIPKDGIPSE